VSAQNTALPRAQPWPTAGG